jgi:hypothetical protein
MKAFFDAQLSWWRQLRSLQTGALSTPVLVLLLVVIIALTTYPALDWENARFQARAEAVTQVARSIAVSSQPTEGSRIITVSLTPFASARVIVDVKRDPGGRPAAPARQESGFWIIPTDAFFVVQWDVIILALSFLIVAFVARQTLRSQIVPSSMRTGNSKARATEGTSAEFYLARDVERALERSEELFSRSTLLLVGGVVMAFVGVAIFFVSLSEAGVGLSGAPIITSVTGNVSVQPVNLDWLLSGVSSRQIFQAFKSTAMLIFIEAIAWFLLRQYRALIEDYKSFYRYYMRRANYLASLKLVAEYSDVSLRARLVETLLSEDLSGRLKSGETTEVLEGQRLVDGNFAEGIVSKSAEIATRVLSQEKKAR